MPVARSTLPHLHTHYLYRDQQALCLRNPTYATKLASLEHLYQQVIDLNRAIAKQEAQEGRLPGGVGLSEAERLQYPVEMARKERDLLERNLLEWDDELAGLAEFLLAKPKFEVKDELELLNGCWYWKLPPG